MRLFIKWFYNVRRNTIYVFFIIIYLFLQNNIRLFLLPIFVLLAMALRNYGRFENYDSCANLAYLLYIFNRIGFVLLTAWIQVFFIFLK